MGIGQLGYLPCAAGPFGWKQLMMVRREETLNWNTKKHIRQKKLGETYFYGTRFLAAFSCFTGPSSCQEGEFRNKSLKCTCKHFPVVCMQPSTVSTEKQRSKGLGCSSMQEFSLGHLLCHPKDVQRMRITQFPSSSRQRGQQGFPCVIHFSTHSWWK